MTPNGTILLVEDNEAFAMAMTTVLERAGFHVVWALDAKGVEVALARGIQPEVVVTDLILPQGPDGLMILRQLQANPALKNMTRVLITGYPDLLTERRHRVPADLAACDAVIVKDQHAHTKLLTLLKGGEAP